MFILQRNVVTQNEIHPRWRLDLGQRIKYPVNIFPGEELFAQKVQDQSLQATHRGQGGACQVPASVVDHPLFVRVASGHENTAEIVGEFNVLDRVQSGYWHHAGKTAQYFVVEELKEYVSVQGMHRFGVAGIPGWLNGKGKLEETSLHQPTGEKDSQPSHRLQFFSFNRRDLRVLSVAFPLFNVLIPVSATGTLDEQLHICKADVPSKAGQAHLPNDKSNIEW